MKIEIEIENEDELEIVCKLRGKDIDAFVNELIKKEIAYLKDTLSII